MLVLYGTFLVLTVTVSVYDALTGEIPRICFAVYFSFLLVYCALFMPQSLVFRIAESAITAVFFLAVRKFTCGGLGLADVWFAGVSAGTFPFLMWVTAMALGCSMAAVFMLATKKKKAPLLPFLGAGFAAIILFETYLKSKITGI